ncbi:CopG family ribbon-helix-helix protein [Pseudorhodoferax sp. Leaf267]|uniref:CopG family ribbon-helix-helix protein n=1 Tax=Pseudorhodoferax sp. Leaf267 TaxID=1736316 RepID=UPI0007009439|nr:ribbon-helix-helix protein, CopG family [Pseudorhodoferax sp. Leaf267]
METIVLTANVPQELAEKIDRVAERLRQPRGWIVEQALSAWLHDEDVRNQRTREALDDVDAGRLVDHQAVLAWAASLGSAQPRPLPSA